MNRKKVLEQQHAVLKALSGKIDDYYLAGGTALSLFYFQHRLSVDLDFFTPDYSIKRISGITDYLQNSLKKEIRLAAQFQGKDKAKFQIFNVYFGKDDTLKVDFVEDLFKLIKEPKSVEGIKILSLEDIYIRKLYAIAGMIPALDTAGRKKFLGQRAEAKDFFDVYFLSSTFMALSEFCQKYADANLKEGLVTWFRAYDRMKMVDGVLTLETDKKVDYKAMEKHFAGEAGRMVEKLIG